MSEFSRPDVMKWLALSLKRNCSISSAVYYSLFFECQNDSTKLARALSYLCIELGLDPKAAGMLG